MQSFDADETGVLGRAYDRALDQFMRDCVLNAGDLETAREKLAMRILQLAEAGE